MRGEGHVKMETEARVVQLQLQTKEHWGWLLPASSRSWEEAGEDSTQNLRGSTALPTPSSRHTASRTEKEWLSVVYNHPV